MTRTSIDELLRRERQRLQRVGPEQAHAAMRAGARLIDIRAAEQRREEGCIPGALHLPRLVLEWRLDPDSEHRHRDAPGLDEQVILMCNDGWASSLAAATLQDLGFARATDLDGGFRGWRRAGLPVCAEPDVDRPAEEPRGPQPSVAQG